MIGFILLFFPAIFSVAIDKKITNYEVNKFNIITKYTLYTTIILLLSSILIFLVTGSESYWYTNFDSVTFTMKYLIMSFVLSMIIPIILNFITKNFDVKIKIDKAKNEKGAK